MRNKAFHVESDRELHRRWFLVPVVIFALLAAVAVFGHGHSPVPASATQPPAGDRL